ncbi:MAG: secretin N-terminal domain-containing protein [Fuerstiella sp.]|nr:secretin N-terminal domain-containing protein [Fuerstiella sp.]
MTDLQLFDYNSTQQDSRQPTTSGRNGVNDLRAAAAARNSGELPQSKDGDVTQDNVEFVVYPLRHTQAVEVSKLVQQLWSPAEAGARIIADERNNSLLVSANEQGHAELKKFLQALDGPDETANLRNATAQQQTDRGSFDMEIGPADTVILKGSKENVAAAEQMLKQMSSQQLLDRSKSLKEKVVTRAKQYLNSSSAKKDLEALKQTVREDFDVRQKLQLAEIEFLKARLKDLERRVRQKEKLKDRIIDRRIESLLLDPADVEQKSATEALKRAEGMLRRVVPTDPFTAP